MQKKFSKRAALTSIIVVILCCALLIGNTFAWFTDTASTGVNTINSGKLDLEVYYAHPSAVIGDTIAADHWIPLDENSPVFNDEALWEPGYAEVVYFKVVNAGTLALEYTMLADIVEETNGVNVYGVDFYLSNYIYSSVSHSYDKPVVIDDRAEAYGIDALPLQTAAKAALNGELSLDWHEYLLPGEAAYTTMVLYMPTTIDNIANYSTKQPEIKLGVNFNATQFEYEEDSFGNDYDADAMTPALETRPARPSAGDDFNIYDEQYKGIIPVEPGVYEPEGIVLNQIRFTKPITVNTREEIFFGNCSGDLALDLQDEHVLLIDGGTYDSLWITGIYDQHQIWFMNDVIVDGVKVTRDNFKNYVDPTILTSDGMVRFFANTPGADDDDNQGSGNTNPNPDQGGGNTNPSLKDVNVSDYLIDSLPGLGGKGGYFKNCTFGGTVYNDVREQTIFENCSGTLNLNMSVTGTIWFDGGNYDALNISGSATDYQIMFCGEVYVDGVRVTRANARDFVKGGSCNFG